MTATRTLSNRRMPWAFLLVCCLVSPANGNDGVQWRSDYNTARREATEKGLPLFLDVGTEECYHCRRLDQSTYRDRAVAKLLNERFVPLKINANREPALAQVLRIQAYPTLIFAGPDGKIMGMVEGYLEAPRLAEHLNPPLATAAPAEKPETRQRQTRAGELLALAREEFRKEHFLRCLDHCDVVSSNFKDTPAAVEAAQIAADIKSSPERMAKVCDSMTERTAQMYAALAETWIKKDNQQEAIECLEKVLLLAPNSSHAVDAETRLVQLKSRTPGTPVQLSKPRP